MLLVPVTPHLVHSVFPPSLQCRQSGSDTRVISLCVPELPHLSLLFLSRYKLTPNYGLLHCSPKVGIMYQVVVQSWPWSRTRPAGSITLLLLAVWLHASPVTSVSQSLLEKYANNSPIAWGHWVVDERLALCSLVCAQWVLLLSLLSLWKSALEIQVFEPVFPTSHSRSASGDYHACFLPSLESTKSSQRKLRANRRIKSPRFTIVSDLKGIVVSGEFFPIFLFLLEFQNVVVTLLSFVWFCTFCLKFIVCSSINYWLLPLINLTLP